ncbi:Ig-like domain-containing protein [Ectobacillus sp. JY-23]|nr:Ig-like domain-containing protein [Ectobacillus sp. JY-23]
MSLSYGAPKGVIDSPVPGTTLRGDHTVSGWFLDGSGVAKIEVLVDGEVVGRAAYGDARPDVKRAYPEYNNGHAGYHYTLDTTKFSSGTHRITIRETGANGQVITLPDRIVTISSAQGYMDNPAPDETMSGSYNVSGWFLDESGVAKIEVLIDGKVIGEASYGDARPDVQRAYPRYNNANAGYQYTLNTTLLSEGMHRITVRETGKNGMVMTLPERSIQVLNAVGYIDNPSSEELISGIYNVSGWFVEKSGVAKVEVLVDGKAAGEAIYGDARPDVKRALPYFNNENAGYHYALDTAKFSEGTHRIAVKGIGKNGKMTILPERTVTIQNVLGYVDSPAPERTLSGKIDVAGWFLDTNHVAKIEVLVDDQVVGEAEYGEARPDVKRAFPRFNNGNAGYRYTLDTTKFNDGSHTITVKETGKNGKVTTLSKRTVKVQNVLGYVDSPAPNTTLSGKYNVSGWFVDKSGVAKVEVLVDGKVVGEAIYGEVRPDVKRAFPEFHNENAGYRYNWDTAAFSVGAHTITVRETNKNGKVTTLPERNITIKNVH